MIRKIRFALLVSATMLFGLQASAQTYTQVTHTSGTSASGTMSVTVTPGGSASTLTPCGTVASPYFLPNNGDSYLYSFSSPVSSVKVELLFAPSASSGVAHFKVNGTDVILTAANMLGIVSPNCGDNAPVTIVSGNATDGGTIGIPSGEILIPGPINSIEVISADNNSIVYGLFFQVNSAPTFTGGSTQTLAVCQNSGANSINALLAANDADAGQTENWTVSSPALHGAVAATYSITSTGSTLTPTGLTYTPTSGYSGTDTFSVQVNDNNGGTATTEVRVTVNPLPAAIGGTTTVCVASTTALTDADGPGTWSSSTTSVATIGTDGVATGLMGGTSVITYTLPTTCRTSTTVTVIPTVTPGVTIIPTPGDTVCSGAALTFTTNVVNGGAAPMYAWSVNGSGVSTTGDAHTYTPTDGDVVKVTVTSNAVCPLPAAVTDTQRVVVIPTETPTVHVSTYPGETVCQGSPVIFTATSTHGGTAPVYSWYKNLAALGVTGTTYTYVPANGEIISARLNSNYRCPAVNDVNSNNVAMVVKTAYLPTASITANTGLSIAKGTPVTFTLYTTNAGPKPTYQWIKNHVAVAGATTTTYTTSALANGDSITCVVWGTGECSYYTFNSVKMRVSTGFADAGTIGTEVSIMPNPTSGLLTINGTFGNGVAEATLEVVNMMGQRVYTGKATLQNGILDQQLQLDSALPSGMYILNMRTDQGTRSAPFLLRR